MDNENLNSVPEEPAERITIEGLELTEGQLQQIAGGQEIHVKCPGCGKDYLLGHRDPNNPLHMTVTGSHVCSRCKLEFGYDFDM